MNLLIVLAFNTPLLDNAITQYFGMLSSIHSNLLYLLYTTYVNVLLKVVKRVESWYNLYK